MIRQFLNTTVQIRRRHTTGDGMGGQTVQTVTVGELPAKVDQTGLSEDKKSERWGAEHTNNVYFLPGEEVMRDDEIVSGSRVYRVLGTTWPSRAVYLKAECELREDGL